MPAGRVPDYRLSRKANADIRQIARAAMVTWGEAVTETYLLGLHAMFGRLSDQPGIGRPATVARPGLMRFEAQRHIVFYRATVDGIVVIRLLHDRMDPARHL